MLKSNVTSHYARHSLERIAQGDILRDIKLFAVGAKGAQIEYNFTYAVIANQDCDLNSAWKIHKASLHADGTRAFNQYLPSIFIFPAFPETTFRSGEHLRDVFRITTEKIPTDRIKAIRDQRESRYHFLPAAPAQQVPDLVIDFKIFFSLDFYHACEKYHSWYLVTINELFRESFLQRLSNYSSRIGLPELP